MATGTSDKELESVTDTFERSSLTDVTQSSTLNYFPLAMIKDKKTEMYVKFAKVMVIFQGPYIDDRSKTLEMLRKKFNYSSRILSDETYTRERNSPCEMSSTEEFYDYFEFEAQSALEEGNNLLVIDATMSHMELNKHYIALAHKMQYVVLVIPPVVSGTVSDNWPRNSQAQSFRKGGTFIHSATMYKHLFCGWFLHDVDSHELRHEAALYIEDCIDNIPEFKSRFESCLKSFDAKSKSSNKSDPELDVKAALMDRIKHYYRLEEKRQDVACCVTKVFTKMFEMNEYFKKEEVRRNYGKMSKLLIAGFIISPHMIAARVKLTSKGKDITANQKELFQMEDELDESTKAQLPLPSEILLKAKASFPTVKPKLISSKSNQTLINSGKSVDKPLEVIQGRARGRSCHILLATAPEAPSHNVDYDVAFSLKRESKAMKGAEVPEVIELERCLVKVIGKYSFIYLKELLVVDGFFASSIEAYPYENAIARAK